MTALELLPRRVTNIFICSMVVFCASSMMMKASLSVRPRMKASGATSMTLRLEHLVDLHRVEQVVERVVERAQVGIDLLLQRAGQKAQTFAGFDRRANQDDAADLFGHQGGDRHGDGEIGLAGTGGAEAEGHVALLDGLDVLALVGRARLHHALDAGGALLAGVDQRTQRDRRIGDDQLQHAVQFAVVEIDA